ncbi:unnamed protein product [Parascedosporium putredinis]|uniref:Acetyl-CoA synthetase-like protein n=1 Tax=Parascedosporium putredinis TaxID=1442378 RepID=A0A9P1H413_9PEZI|nr:unnamed protein product [Parascedosporium putredinis]CAI7996287.1 unnamed protein product [Parascedosporium putredinis]
MDNYFFPFPTSFPVAQAAESNEFLRRFPEHNIFEFIANNPFQEECDFVPAAHKLAPIEPSRPIFVDYKSGRTVTHGQLKQDSLAVAGALQSLGLDPNNVHVLPPTPTCARPEVAPVVLIQVPNCLSFPTLVLGAFASGLTATLVSPALTSEEISWILQNARPRAIITATNCVKAMRAALAAQEDAAYFANVPLFTVEVANETRDPVVLGYLGPLKGVLLSHNALNFSIGSIWHDADYFQGLTQKWLGYVPFYHVFGLCNILLLTVSIGATVYVMPSFHLETVLQAIPKQGITYFHMAPPVAVMLAKAAIVEKYAKRDANGRNAFSSVVAGVTGGAPLGHEVVVEVYKRLGFRVRLGYGLSEACSTTLQRGYTEADMHAQAGDSGKPHWGDGEILIRCPGLMSAYLPIGGLSPGAKPDMGVTAEALTHDGWFRTGDVGILCTEGRLRITDRLKEMIKVRAFQVAPAELEAILCSSDDVADAGVVGIYDNNEATEWPRAFVVPRVQAGEAELRELAHKLARLVEGRTAKYKWLQGGIIFVEAIPKSPSGKILRRIMKDGGVKGFEVQIYQRKKRDAKL